MSKPPISSSVCPHCGHALNARAPVHVGAGLTEKQRAALDFISEFIAERGFSPNYNEIAAGLSLSSRSIVNRLVVALTQRGYVTRIPGRRRSIAVVPAVARAA